MSKIMLGYELRNHTDIEITEYLNQLAKIDQDLITERETNRDEAAEAIAKLYDYNKRYYDKHHKKPSQYKGRDYVLIRDTQSKLGQNRKLKFNYKGPYIVSKVLKNNRYVVQDIPGFNITPKPYNTILSPHRLKPWIKPL